MEQNNGIFFLAQSGTRFEGTEITVTWASAPLDLSPSARKKRGNRLQTRTSEQEGMEKPGPDFLNNAQEGWM